MFSQIYDSIYKSLAFDLQFSCHWKMAGHAIIWLMNHKTTSCQCCLFIMDILCSKINGQHSLYKTNEIDRNIPNMLSFSFYFDRGRYLQLYITYFLSIMQLRTSDFNYWFHPGMSKPQNPYCTYMARESRMSKSSFDGPLYNTS